MSKFFDDLKGGLKGIVACKKDKMTLRSESIYMPKPPADYTAADIKKIRAKGQYSQGIFARVLNVSIRTVQSWESGERAPNQAALRLLEIIDKGLYRPQLSKKRK